MEQEQQHHYRVMVVDDDVSILEELKEIFELEGYQVTTAASGNEALTRLAAAPIDLLLSDIRMPDGDGKFLLKRVRSEDPSIPFIFMTGFSDLDAGDAMEMGASAYLQKPMDVEELLNVMQDCLSKAYQYASNGVTPSST